MYMYTYISMMKMMTMIIYYTFNAYIFVYDQENRGTHFGQGSVIKEQNKQTNKLFVMFLVFSSLNFFFFIFSVFSCFSSACALRPDFSERSIINNISTLAFSFFRKLEDSFSFVFFFFNKTLDSSETRSRAFANFRARINEIGEKNTTRK